MATLTLRNLPVVYEWPRVRCSHVYWGLMLKTWIPLTRRFCCDSSASILPFGSPVGNQGQSECVELMGVQWGWLTGGSPWSFGLILGWVLLFTNTGGTALSVPGGLQGIPWACGCDTGIETNGLINSGLLAPTIPLHFSLPPCLGCPTLLDQNYFSYYKEKREHFLSWILIGMVPWQSFHWTQEWFLCSIF